MASIVLIESPCSERYCWRDRKMPSITFLRLLSSPLRSIFRNVLQKTERTVEKNFLAIMLRSSDRPASWKQVSGKIFKRVRESGPSHDTIQSALGHETLFLRSFSFLPASTFIFPFHTRKNGIRCSRKVSYKTIDTREENLARHRTNRVRSCPSQEERKFYCYVSRLKKRFRFTLIIRCRSVFWSWWN